MTCEHLFVTSQSSPYARFRRALDSQNVTVAYATATELDFVSLPEALELVLLVVDDPRRFHRAALRWHVVWMLFGAGLAGCGGVDGGRNLARVRFPPPPPPLRLDARERRSVLIDGPDGALPKGK